MNLGSGVAMSYTMFLSKNAKIDKQTTLKGHHIPIPTRKDFFENLRKA
jgi:hypothetical protein